MDTRPDELQRLDDEQRQVNSETTWSAEQLRRDAEVTRDFEEQRREHAEMARVTAEFERESAETYRTTGEQERYAAEAARVAAEETRYVAEAARDAAEAARREAEQMRQDLYRMSLAVDDLARKIDALLAAAAPVERDQAARRTPEPGADSS